MTQNSLKANKTKKSKLKVLWARNTVGLAFLSIAIVTIALILSNHYANTCQGFLCGLGGYLIFVPITILISILILIFGLRKYVINDWPTILVVTFGAIVIVFSTENYINNLYSISGFKSEALEAVSFWIVLTLSLLILIRICSSIKTRRSSIYVAIIICLIIIGALATHITASKATAESKNYNLESVHKVGVSPYLPTDPLPGYSINVFTPYYYSTPDNNYYELNYVNFNNNYYLYEYKSSSQLDASNCEKYNKNNNISDAIWTPCVSVGSFNQSTIYYSEYIPNSNNQSSTTLSTYYVQLGSTTLVLTDFPSSSKVLNQASALKIIDSLQPLSDTKMASLLS